MQSHLMGGRLFGCAEGVCASDPEQRRPRGSVSGLDRGALPPGVGAQPAG